MSSNTPVYFEDLIGLLWQSLFYSPMQLNILDLTQSDPWEKTFLKSTSEIVLKGSALSTKQVETISRLVRSNIDAISKKDLASKKTIFDILANPRFRNTPYQTVNVIREVRYLGDNLIGFRFKHTPEVQKAVCLLGERNLLGDDYPRFYPLKRLWVVRLNRETLAGITTLITAHNFSYGDDIIEVLTAAHNALGGQSTAVSDRSIIAIQVCDDELLGWAVQHTLGGEVV